MTAATITDRIEINDSSKEVVIVTADDLNTYVSRKFATVTAAQATIMEDAGTLTYPLSLDIATSTVEINCEGMSGLKICLTLYGRK